MAGNASNYHRLYLVALLHCSLRAIWRCATQLLPAAILSTAVPLFL